MINYGKRFDDPGVYKPVIGPNSERHEPSEEYQRETEEFLRNHYRMLAWLDKQHAQEKAS